MSPVKFVHVLKRIESLERDISEIHSLAQDLNSDREYSTPVKISLEQQVNNLLNEKTRLMEVRVENAPEYLNPEKKKMTVDSSESVSRYSFDEFEREFYDEVRYRRSNYSKDSVPIQETIKADIPKSSSRELKGLPSLAEKSLLKPEEVEKEDETTFIKRREDILKNLPPLEY